MRGMENTTILHIRIPPELDALLKKVADLKRTSVSEHVRQTLWRNVDHVESTSDQNMVGPV